MFKKILSIAIIILVGYSGIAQVGIGTTSPDASSALEVNATDKGFLMPRMTTAQKDAIATPAVGLQVYDTDTKSVWTYDGTVWKEGSGGAGKFVDGATPDIAYYGGRVGIGRNSFSTGHTLYVERKNTEGSNVPVKIDAIKEGSGTGSTLYGMGAQANNQGTGTINYAIGTQGIALNAAGGTISNAVGSWPQLTNSGNVTWGAGLVIETANNSGTIGTGYGANINVSNKSGASMGQASIGSFYVDNAGTITGNSYGLWIGGTGSGSVSGNSYALYIATPFSNVSGNNFALYSENTADSYIEGNVGFGTQTPARKVHISGAMRLEPQASAPVNGALGDLYVGTDGKLYFHNGTAWKEVQLN
jgi:hypothetical protein